MKLICDRALLANAIAGVSKAVTQRSSIPVLEGILPRSIWAAMRWAFFRGRPHSTPPSASPSRNRQA